MNINCTNSCAHQKDGKCLLNELQSTASVIGYLGFECPYFKQLEQAPIKRT